MEQAIQVLFAVIAIGIGIIAVYNIISANSDSMLENYNDLSLEMLAEKGKVACNVNTFGSNTAIIEAVSGSLFFGKEKKICYTYNNKTRCQPVSCNVSYHVFLNLTDPFIIKTYDTHRFRCTLSKAGNITINCTG